MAESTPTPALIREAREGDARAIAEAHVQSWQATYHGLLPEAYLQGLADNLQRRVDFIDNAIRNGGRDIRVAERDGVVLGWSSFGASRDDDVEPGTGELYSIYLVPAAWSAGIGSALWRASRQALEAAGFARVTLWALDGNARAERFYRAAGFTPQASSSRVFEEDGTAFPVTRYLLPLTHA
ncbi:GNAT family N-acetyltransferase [Pseudomonas citronellolis]|uniref:GNAT family N-acetyltransferase n=1 Tax=Pseudomonas citronellolis TaxID=53408 RepID=UPI0023E433E3|nr:GNAT family N-acetyltransferase [Pseudomonas citronellolis]MDF3932922.1 GNAT family N-acetyltransferase [Pseudomonas citronellolis]